MKTHILRRVSFLTLAMAYSFDVDAASLEMTEVSRELQGVTFEVSVSHQESIKTLRIQPRGLLIDNKTIERNIDENITAIEVADINVDNSPEVYVFMTSAGNSDYGSLIAYSANKKKSLTEIYLPPPKEDAKTFKGYRGHDEFQIIETSLARRFPVYKDQDSDDKPTGGMRQIQYKLKAGEGGWVLRMNRVDHF